MSTIKFDLSLPSGDFSASRAAAQRAEDLGYYSVSIPDHFFMRGIMETPESPHLECYTHLAALAASTHHIRLLPLVTAMSYRNPALLAKMMSTVDHISGGRLIAGLGAGWFREEYLAYGYPYPSNAERIDQLCDGIKLLKAMWTQDEPTYSGRFFKVEKAYNFPRPVQKPHPPILIGGSGKQVLKIAAEQADIANLIPPVLHGVINIAEAVKFTKDDFARRIETLRGLTRAAGRDPGSVEISGMSFVLTARDRNEVDAMVRATAQAMGVPDAGQALKSPMVLAGTIDELKSELRWRVEKLGITYFVLNFPTFEMAELFSREVMPEFRD